MKGDQADRQVPPMTLGHGAQRHDCCDRACQRKRETRRGYDCIDVPHRERVAHCVANAITSVPEREDQQDSEIDTSDWRTDQYDRASIVGCRQPAERQRDPINKNMDRKQKRDQKATDTKYHPRQRTV